jgi:hypothetical protein
MTVKLRPVSAGNKKRVATRLASGLEKNLLAYAAAGAGLMAIAQPAAAEVIYTPSNIPITQGFAGGSTTSLDLNNDGTADFAFSNFSYFTHGLGEAYLKILPDQTGNEIAGIQIKGQRHITAAALPAGVEVGPSANFQSSPQGLFMAGIFNGSQNNSFSGSWLKVETAYVGLKFMVDGETHYGWARVKLVGPGAYSSASIYGYAYESIPNQAIVTGQSRGTAANQQISKLVPPPVSASNDRDKSLGMLAAGALVRSAQSSRSAN